MVIGNSCKVFELFDRSDFPNITIVCKHVLWYTVYPTKRTWTSCISLGDLLLHLWPHTSLIFQSNDGVWAHALTFTSRERTPRWSSLWPRTSSTQRRGFSWTLAVGTGCTTRRFSHGSKDTYAVIRPIV